MCINFEEEYKQIDVQIKELQQRKYDLLVQAVEAKGLKTDTKFKINNMGWCKNKYFKVLDELTYYQLTKSGKLDKRISYLKFNFSVLKNVEIVEP